MLGLQVSESGAVLKISCSLIPCISRGIQHSCSAGTRKCLEVVQPFVHLHRLRTYKAKAKKETEHYLEPMLLTNIHTKTNTTCIKHNASGPASYALS